MCDFRMYKYIYNEKAGSISVDDEIAVAGAYIT